MTSQSVHRLERALYLAGICALAALVVFAGIPRSTQFMHVLHKTGHPLAFGSIAVLALRLFQRNATDGIAPTWRPYAMAFATAVALGVLTEVAQRFTNRGSSVTDVLNDAVGALAGLGIFASISRAREIADTRRRRTTVLLVGIVAACFALAPLAWCVAAYANREARFPTLLKIDSSLDRYFVSSTNGAVVATPVPANWAHSTGETALIVTFAKGESAGVQVVEPHPDWRGYQTLKLDISNTGSSDLPINLRVHDSQHNWRFEDRFNRTVTLKALARQTILVPVVDITHGPQQRMMDLSHIANLAVFVWQPQNGGQFLLHSVTLE